MPARVLPELPDFHFAACVRRGFVDNALIPVPDCPEISGHRIYHRSFIDVHRGGSKKQRLHARLLFYGKLRMDFVQVETDLDDTVWYAQLLLLFDAQAIGATVVRQMALVAWLDPTPAEDVPDATSLRYFGTVDVINVSSILGRARLVTSPRREDDGSRRFLLLARGKGNRHLFPNR